MQRNVPKQSKAPKARKRPRGVPRGKRKKKDVRKNHQARRERTASTQHAALPAELWRVVLEYLAVPELGRCAASHREARASVAHMAERLPLTAKAGDAPLRRIAFWQRREAWPRPHRLSSARYNGLRIKPGGSIEALGRYYAWSCNLASDFRVVSVVKTNMHALALDAKGAVYCWGNGMFGQTTFQSFDVQVMPRRIEHLPPVALIAANDSFSAILTRSGHVFTWGFGQYGQGGHGDRRCHSKPKRVKALSNVKHVAVADYHCAAVVGDEGSVYTWGSNHFFKCGIGAEETQTTPWRVPALTGVASVTIAHHYTAVVTKDGSAFLWGGNLPCRLSIKIPTRRIVQAEAATSNVVLRTDQGCVHYVIWDMTVQGIQNVHCEAAGLDERVTTIGVANDNEVLLEQADGKIIGVGEHARSWFRLYNDTTAL